MLIVALTCALLIALTTTLHYEVLRGLNVRLANLPIPNRSKLLVVIFTAFIAHFLEIGIYGVAVYVLTAWWGLGALEGINTGSFIGSLYFSAETYTSLGFGDVTPAGPIRLIAGVEALNGLLLIGWSASYTYFAMERFWKDETSRSES